MTKQYELKPRRTAEDWDAVEDENPLAKQMRTVQRRAEQVIRGYPPVCYLSGGAGLGKSFAILQAIRSTGATVIRAMPKNVRELEHFFERSNGTTPLIFEECDHLFNSTNSLNLLKIATDSAGPRSIEVYVAPKKRSESGSFKTIPLTAPTIIACNGDLSNDCVWPTACVPHIEALRSREQPLYIQGDHTARWEYATYLALRRRMLTKTETGIDVPLQVQNEAIQWFADTMWRQSEVSPRRLMKIVNVMMADHLEKKRVQRSGSVHDHRALGEDLEQFLLPQAGDLPLPPVVPAIFVSPKMPSSISRHAA
ncbi:ATP-binding protein [Microvirga arabica]|uniref:ATP-binding protein n=1 Tax=Microvirga arabica TaxID=1128671 RepID=UPI001939AB22|nr:ATP-binding protein [Microvirga arabica]MBM1169611.1 ATP-binding protein [Microvirga arabica]